MKKRTKAMLALAMAMVMMLAMGMTSAAKGPVVIAVTNDLKADATEYAPNANINGKSAYISYNPNMRAFQVTLTKSNDYFQLGGDIMKNQKSVLYDGNGNKSVKGGVVAMEHKIDNNKCKTLYVQVLKGSTPFPMEYGKKYKMEFDFWTGVESCRGSFDFQMPDENFGDGESANPFDVQTISVG